MSGAMTSLVASVSSEGASWLGVFAPVVVLVGGVMLGFLVSRLIVALFR